MMRRVFSLLLALTIIVSCGSMWVKANAAEVDEPISTYEWMRLTHTQTITYGNGYKVKISIPYIASTDLSNASGLRVASIEPGTVTNVAKWYAVQSSLTVNSTRYEDNYQKAILNVTYYASIGAGYTPYTTTVTITVPSYSG